MEQNGIFTGVDGIINMKGTLKGKVLTLEIDLTKNYGPSKSGKTMTCASTGGFKKVPGTAHSINLNVNMKEAI